MNDLDNFFEYLLSQSISKDLNLSRDYPNYKKIVRKYKESFDKSKQGAMYLYGSLGGQLYTLPFNILGADTFELKINIDLLMYLIDNEKEIWKPNDIDYKKDFKISNFDEDIVHLYFLSEFLERIIDESQIDKNYAMKCTNKNEPVICGDFSGLSPNEIPFFIIDGNHKAYGKIKAGKDKINGILVGRNIWMKALLTEEDKLFVKIFNNISYILSYRSGNTSKEMLNKNMYEIN